MSPLVSRLQGHRLSDRELMRLRRLALSFTKTNRLITQDKEVGVELVTGQIAKGVVGSDQIPGWATYPNVFINIDAFDAFKSKKTLVELLGLNYHEVAHILFTPRGYKNELNRAESKAFTILEDQRIESFFTALYQPAGKYFTAMVVKMFVERSQTWEDAFIYTYGRSFLPLDVREEFEARFKSPEKVERIKELINQYKRLTHFQFEAAGPNSKARRIISEFSRIINDLEEEHGDDFEDSDCGDPTNGKPQEDTERDARDKDRKRREKEERTGEDQSGFWEDEDEEDEEDAEEEDESASNGAGEDEEDDNSDGDDEGDSSVGSGDEDGEDSDGTDSDGSDSEGDDGSSQGDEESGEGDGNAGGDGSADQEDGDDVEGDDEGSDGAGSSSDRAHSEPQFDDDEFENYLDDIMVAVNEDENVSQDIRGITAAMNDDSNIDVMDFNGLEHTDRPATPVMISLVEKSALELRRLYAEVEPGWKYGTDNGRFNVGRAMSDPENVDEMFDEWDEGREQETGVECFISVDTSGSMGGAKIAAASKALWIIKRSLDEVEAKTTVVAFDYGTTGLFSRDDQVDRHQWPLWTELGGSTQPVTSFKMARRIMEATELPNRLFICITDGIWNNMDVETGQQINYQDVLREIQAMKMFIGIGVQANSEQKRLFDVSVNLPAGDSDGLVGVVESAVTHMLRQRIG